jgi:hypothetical protein
VRECLRLFPAIIRNNDAAVSITMRSTCASRRSLLGVPYPKRDRSMIASAGLLFWHRGRPISPHAGKRRLIEPHTFFNGPHLRATAGLNLAGA